MPYLPGLRSFQNGRSKRTKAPVKRQRRMSRPVSTTTPAFKKAVRKVVLSTTETKTAQYYSGTQLVNNIFWGTTAFDNGVQYMCPNNITLQIPQGDGQGERIGNKIVLESLLLDVMVYPMAYDATFNASPQPAYVKFWFIAQKNLPSSFPAVSSNRMVQDGDASISLGGRLRDLTCPLNAEFVTTYTTRMCKIGNSSYLGLGANAAVQNWTNNEFTLGEHFKIDLAKYLPKSIIYDDTTGLPTSRGLFMFVEFVDIDNSNPTNVHPVAYEYTLSMKYKDP